jgi:hypothetical protein
MLIHNNEEEEEEEEECCLLSHMQIHALDITNIFQFCITCVYIHSNLCNLQRLALEARLCGIDREYHNAHASTKVMMEIKSSCFVNIYIR